MFDPKVPYNDLPPLPPMCDLGTGEILRATVDAGRMLAELKGRSAALPNPAILLNTIALQEAKASSEVENIFTTNDELYRSVGSATPALSSHTREVLHYNRALWRGTEILAERPVLTTNLFVEIVNTIKGNTAGVRTQPGTRVANAATGEVLYTPPEGEGVIRDKLRDLETFSNTGEDGLDPLIKMALIHYQFEAIHPFYDGNGRAGRILAVLFLIASGLLDQPILFLSRYIIEHKSGYYRRLMSVTADGEWEPWVLYMLRAVTETARDTHGKILAICDLLDQSMERAKSGLPRHTYSGELVELTFEQPYCRIRHLEEAGLGNRHTCSRYLKDMEAAGLLSSRQYGRDKVFINLPLMAILAGDERMP